MKAWKKGLAMLMATVAVIPVGAGFTVKAESNEKYEVAFIVRNAADSFVARIINSFEEEAKNYDDLFSLEILDAQADSDKQNSLIETCITKGYDCIIVQPNDGDLQKPYCEQVLNAGIKLITTNAGIREIEGGSWVDANPYEQGEVLAKLATENAPENARVVMMSCNPGNLHTESRLQAYKDVFLGEREDVELLAEKITDRADEATFMATMEDWVQSFGKIDVVMTIGDTLALSAYEVVKDDDTYKDTQYYGVDGLPESLLAIKRGHMTATVMQDTDEMAQLNLEAAAKLLKGEEEVIESEMEAILITADNVDEYLDYYVEKGALTQEEVDEVRAEVDG